MGGSAAAAPHASGGASASDAAHYSGDSKHLGDRWLRQGMTGHDVRVLQQYLGFAGFRTHITGSFDPSTTRSVIAFQRKHKLSDDGVVTADVASSLRKAVAAAVNANRPHGTTRINGDGTATAPAGAPPQVLAAVAAANRIIHTSYCYAGGHGSWNSSCYDCSGSVSYALAAGGLLSAPVTSGELESWGVPGPGRYITVLAAAGHTYMYVDGIMYNTAGRSGTYASRWQVGTADSSGFVARHWPGL
jgi:hypothetical protein